MVGRRGFTIETSTADAPTRPRVVALGGGHGLASSLRAGRVYAGELTGIVSVGDDGGSSGRLRRELGLPAPGDLRRCLSALASRDSLLAQAMEHRFDQGALAGHPVGNLLIAGLAASCGDLVAAVDEVAHLLGAEGRLLPATTGLVTLVADSDHGRIEGEVVIDRAPGIRNLRFDPPDPTAPDEAVAAIEQADQVILGPGSLFTSVLAVAVVPDLHEALATTSAQVVYVANVANERAAAKGFDLAAHVRAVHEHGIEPDLVLAHGHDVVETIERRAAVHGVPTRWADLAGADRWSHDPAALGRALSRLV